MTGPKTHLSDETLNIPSLRRQFSLTGWAILAFAVGLILVVAITGWEDVVNSVSALGPFKLAALSALALAHYLVRAIRWQVMVSTGGVQLPWATNALYFFGGFSMIATPGRIGELIRLRWLMRSTGQGLGQVLPIAFADRAIELASIVGLIALALAATNLGSSAVWWVLLAGFGVAWMACRPNTLLAVVKPIVGTRYPDLFAKLRRLTGRLEPFMRLRTFLPVLLIGMIGWAFEGLAFWLLLDWLGAGIALPAATAVFLIAVLSGALSGLPGGLGGTEATSVALLTLQGVPLDIAVLATAIIRIATLWFAVAIGLAALPLAEAKSSALVK